MLSVNNIEVVYHDVILVLKGVSLEIREGEIVALLGTNGAGKTTTLRAISGLLHAEDGEVRRGSVHFQGQRIDRLPPEAIVRLGIVQVLEGRRIFKHLSVEENLLVGAAGPGRRDRAAVLERVYAYFPRLGQLRRRLAGYCSGGEQQMLAIGRALLARPRLLLLDEPSLGLSPLLVQEIFEIVARINREEGTTVLLVEQNARQALRVASRGYVMENGRIVIEGTAAELRANPDVQEFYLGISPDGRRSYRAVKAYRRRKRYM